MSQALYATAKNLRDIIGVRELAQVSAPAGTTITDADLNTAIDATPPPGAAAPAVVLAYTAIVDAITRASSLIDTRLRAVYTLPLTGTVPDVLRDYCLTIARYDLSKLRATDEMRARYKDAIADLDRIAAGSIDIGATDSAGAQASAGIAFSAPTRDNTYTTLGNFAPNTYAPTGWPTCR